MIIMVNWKLRQLMADRRIGNVELAVAVGVHANTIGKWKAVDEMPKINGEELERLCRALNCSVGQLLGIES